MSLIELRRISVLIAAVAVGALSGCAAMDRIQTSLQPLPPEGDGAAMYLFKGIATDHYPLDTPEGERVRMDWLAGWLRDAGLEGRPYEIVTRYSVKIGTGVIGGTGYNVFYKIRVPVSADQQSE